MPVVVYVDENGDHSLEAVDPHFPIFVLTMMIADVKGYYEKIHEGVILHSRDIRKAQGDFRFLNDPTKREPFYVQLYDVMENCCFTIISVVIRKQAHKDKYGKAARNPYDLAFTFALERLLLFSKAMTRPKCS